MLNVVRTACALMLIGVSPAFASDQIDLHVPDAEIVGQGRLSYMFWDVYDAALFAPNGQWKQGQPFALKLSYLRDLEGEKIADRSIEEIRNQGFRNEVKLADWHSQLRNIFPDVKMNSSITGIYTNEGITIFYQNNQEIGRVNDPEFGQKFFDIWLSQKTSAPSLRKKLLGAA